MNYIQLTIKGQSAPLQEQLIAVLSNHGLNGVEERDDALLAYFSEEAYQDATKAIVAQWQQQHNLQIDTQVIADQNWNAQWEADYQPVIVEDFCAVRATFHPPIAGVVHDLVVTPKMSFGTGHHATTYMMMQRLQHWALDGKQGLDYGCGTGVLAILAHRLGATLDAVDIDPWAYRNTLENLSLNGVTKGIEVYEGTLEVVPPQSYHFILANINRSVILDTLPDMAARLVPGGQLLTSGFLEADVPLVVEKAASCGLTVQHQVQRERWCCVEFSKALA